MKLLKFNIILKAAFVTIVSLLISSVYAEIEDFSNNLRYLNTTEEPQVQICGEKYCLTNQGTCISITRSTCNCNDFFETYPEDNVYQCNYEKKKQIIAFCLELVLMCGTGHLYIGNYYIAIPKFLLFMIGILLIVFLRYYNRDKEEENPVSMKIALAGCIVFCLMLAWEIFDIIMFAFNKYQDSKGVSLYPFKVSIN